MLRWSSRTARWHRTPILPSGTAPTIPAREPSEASATAHRASRIPRKRSNARGSAAQRTTDRSSRTRSRSTSPMGRMRTPENPSAPGSIHSSPPPAASFRSAIPSAFVKASKISPDNVCGQRALHDQRGVRMPRGRPLQGRSGQGRSRKPPREGSWNKPYVARIHARHATTWRAAGKERARRSSTIAAAVIWLAN